MSERDEKVCLQHQVYSLSIILAKQRASIQFVLQTRILRKKRYIYSRIHYTWISLYGSRGRYLYNIIWFNFFKIIIIIIISWRSCYV